MGTFPQILYIVWSVSRNLKANVFYFNNAFSTGYELVGDLEVCILLRAIKAFPEMIIWLGYSLFLILLLIFRYFNWKFHGLGNEKINVCFSVDGSQKGQIFKLLNRYIMIFWINWYRRSKNWWTFILILPSFRNLSI